jgi:hypothetical protein
VRRAGLAGQQPDRAAVVGRGEGPQHLKSGGKLYQMMFEHFPANGHQIKGWHGQFAWKNLAAVEEAMKKGATPKESVLESGRPTRPSAYRSSRAVNRR